MQLRIPWIARAVAIAATIAATIAVTPPASRAQDSSAARRAPDTTLVTDQLIALGRSVFHGGGQCTLCHGASLEGGIGPTLRAHRWKDAGTGDLPDIYRIVSHGVPGTAMVAYPGRINDERARAVAMYVWAVSHGRAKP